MHLHLSSFDSSSDSLENCSSNDAIIVSSRVPFKWEEVPGKPITANMSSCNEIITYNQIALQLPPKLQFQGHQSPLLLQQSPYRLHQSSPLSPCRGSPNHQKLKSLYKYMLKTASWSQPTHDLSQSWSSSACAPMQDKLTINERFFFDKAIPKEFKYSVSMDSCKPRLPIHEEYRHDAFVSSQALSFLAMEEREVESTVSSPQQPIVFHEREGSASPYQPTPIKASKELGGDVDENDKGSPCHPTSIKASKELGGDDEEDDEGFHDFFSTTSSLGKPSQRTDESIEPSYPSSSPWFFDLGPEEEEVHEEKGRSKLVVRLVALVKLKKIISSKVCKLRGRREGANEQANYTSMWSPTLATYLYNQQKEERESSSPSLDYPASEEEEDDDHELPSSYSAASSHRFQINPDYQLPSSILRTNLHPSTDFSGCEGSRSFRVHQLGLDGSPCFSEEEEDPHKLRHRLSLREQLAEFDDEYPVPFLPASQSSPPQILDSKRRELTPSKGMCKVRKTVKVLAATIKLILVQTDVGKMKGQHRPSLKYGGCLKPTVSTLSPLPSTHK